MLLKYKKFVEKVEFAVGKNQDLPANRKIYTNKDKEFISDLVTNSPGKIDINSNTDTVVFDESEEYYYPYSEFKNIPTHGATSHGIKHLLEFDKDFMIFILKKAVNIAKTTDDDLFIIDKYGTAKDADPNEINNLNILNTLDMIQDKKVTHVTDPYSVDPNSLLMTNTEKELLNKVIQPIRERIKYHCNNIMKNAVRLSDNKGEDIVIIPVKASGFNIMFYDWSRQVVMFYNSYKKLIKTIFKIDENILDFLRKDRIYKIEIFNDIKRQLIDYVWKKNSMKNNEKWIVNESETGIIKFKLNEGKSNDVEKLDNGRIKYRNEIFDGFNKPKQYKGKGKFKKRVLAKEGDKIKILNYGHKDYSDYTKHKDIERRKNFRSRHKCDPVSNLSKLTKKYWACQDLW